MAKIVQFPITTSPTKFGLQRADKRKGKEPSKRPGQLPLFTTGKLVKLNQLSTFEEALLLDEQDDKTAARKRYQKAIEESDCAADAYCNLGIIESQEGNHAKAIDCFTNALKHNPRHSEAHYNLANLYAEVGNYPLAKIHYGISIEVEPSFPNAYYNLGLTLALTQEYLNAVNYLQKYQELTPEEEHKDTTDLIFKLQSML